MTSRREFLKGAAWMGAAAAVSGCASEMFKTRAPGGGMALYAAPALKTVRVGVVGLGARGAGAVHRLAAIPGVTVAALCDVRPEAVAAQQAWLAAGGKPKAREFVGETAWRALCDWDGIDVVYNVTPWALHAPIALAAMRGGKHAFVEVPGAMTLDECHELVETSENLKRHCMMLENCCYGEIEMLALNLCRSGVLGELKYGEGAYIHDLRVENLNDPNWRKGRDAGGHGYYDWWRLKWNAAHKGNMYPTHGLGPICQYLDVNRGDRMEYLVSLESQPAGIAALAGARYKADDWRRALDVQSGDMNTTLIKTARGRSIMIQHDVSSPRPYSRINLIAGTKGVLCDYPYRLALEEEPGAGAHEFFRAEKAAEYREKYKHPYWKQAGAIARKVGGHGGMDFLMDLRWAYCLQNGLPLDMNVYDLAAWSSLCELTEKSVRARSASIDIPDFTGGAWKTTPPLGIVTVDLNRMGLDADAVQADGAQLNV